METKGKKLRKRKVKLVKQREKGGKSGKNFLGKMGKGREKV